MLKKQQKTTDGQYQQASAIKPAQARWQHHSAREKIIMTQ